jgi:DNA-binding GntR family transcriptional regulator
MLYNLGGTLMKEYNSFDDQYSLRARVYNSLRENILNGRYKVGENLIELRIAEELNVSRTPVREAIRQLELEGLVESIPNKRFTVKGVSLKDMEDIYRIRKVLEGLSARWAVEQITDEEINELQEVYDLMEFYTQKNDVNQISKLNTRFHEIIFSATKSSVLKHILKDFQFYVKWARHESLSSPGRMEEALKEHLDILQAIRNRSSDDTEKYLTIHVENSSKNLFNKIQEQL